jgi:hypothetical protein
MPQGCESYGKVQLNQRPPLSGFQCTRAAGTKRSWWFIIPCWHNDVHDNPAQVLHGERSHKPVGHLGVKVLQWLIQTLQFASDQSHYGDEEDIPIQSSQ